MSDKPKLTKRQRLNAEILGGLLAGAWSEPRPESKPTEAEGKLRKRQQQNGFAHQGRSKLFPAVLVGKQPPQTSQEAKFRRSRVYLSRQE